MLDRARTGHVSAVRLSLGNRGLLLHLERAGIELNATQRVFGMTLASQPLWWRSPSMLHADGGRRWGR
jgi:hypothetical protein